MSLITRVPENMRVRMMGRSVFIPLPFRNKETGFGLASDAAENPLSFDLVTIVVLRFAKLESK